MSRKTLILSSAGLKNIVQNIISTENDFLFIFGDKEVRTSKINADFISPLISQIHQSDPTMTKYKYPSDDCMKTIFSESNLEHFKNICNGNEVKIFKIFRFFYGMKNYSKRSMRFLNLTRKK